MSKVCMAPSFATLLQDYFVERLMEQRAVSPETISSYRDSFRLFLQFASDRVGRCPSDLTLADMDAPMVLAFLRHLEVNRHNSARTRNVRLAALRSFLKYAAHRDLAALAVVQRALAVPMKRYDKPMVGYLSRDEIHQLLAAPDPDTWCGQRDAVLLATMYTPEHGSQRSSLYVSAMSSLVRHPASIFLAKAAKSARYPYGVLQQR